MKIAVVGGTGFIGQHLVKLFADQGQQVFVISRRIDKQEGAVRYQKQLKPDECYDLIINLAGVSLHSCLWTKEFKNKLVSSRIDTTKTLLDYIQKAPVKPKALFNASAIGIYGNHADKLFLESSEPAQGGFLQNLAFQWEKTAYQAEAHGVPVVYLRFGVVLGERGFLKQLLLPFKAYLGTNLGDGKSWLSWVHIKDVGAAVAFLVEQLKNPSPEGCAKSIQGAWNFTAPEPVLQKEFMAELAKTLRKPLWLRAPQKLIEFFLGELAKEMIFSGQRVYPDRLIAAGYAFQFPKLEDALQDLCAPKQ